MSGNLRMESVFLRAASGCRVEVPSSTVKISEKHIKESRIMNVSHHGRRWVGAASAALLLAVAVPAPAMARLDVGGEPLQNTQEAVWPQCPLRRIERQLVRCDSLTGAGVVAPLWVPEL